MSDKKPDKALDTPEQESMAAVAINRKKFADVPDHPQWRIRGMEPEMIVIARHRLEAVGIKSLDDLASPNDDQAVTLAHIARLGIVDDHNRLIFQGGTPRKPKTMPVALMAIAPAKRLELAKRVIEFNGIV